MNTEPLSASLPGFNSRRVDVGELSLNVVIEGEGPDVLLIHGFPDSHQVWRKQIPALVKAGYRIIAPDLRGFGDSDMAPAVAAYKKEKLVADLANLLDALEIKQAKVVGHDWGAVIGWWLAILHPQKVERYIALSVGHPSAYPRGGVMQNLRAYYVLLLQFRGLIEWALKCSDWWLFRFITRHHPEISHWKQEMAKPGRLTAACNLYRANLDLVLPLRHPPVSMPVMGVWSDGDAFLTEKQMRLSRNYVNNDWRYECVEGASHWLTIDAPDAVNSLILDFFQQTSGARCKHEEQAA